MGTWTPVPTTWALGPLSPPHGHLDPCPHHTLLNHQSFLAMHVDCANIPSLFTCNPRACLQQLSIVLCPLSMLALAVFSQSDWCVLCTHRYVFDGLNEDQAVELLSLHGHDGTYLVINNSGSSTWSFVVRQRWAPFRGLLGGIAGYSSCWSVAIAMMKEYHVTSML